jgi:RNA ligase
MYPHIQHIDDVLPFIKDFPEFRVTEKDDFTVIDYMITTENTFKDEDPVALAIRKECRGIKFDKDGFIAARGFEKFFNVGENDYSQPHNIDWSIGHEIYPKKDGSSVFPCRHGDSYRLTTRAGITEHAMDAEVFVVQNPQYHDFITEMIGKGKTPIFEWESHRPEHQIVIQHKKASLVLLAIRDNISGYTWEPTEADSEVYGIEINKPIEFDGDINKLLAYTKDLTGEEGFVLYFNDGKKFKVKSDWYALRHRSKDLVRWEKDVLKMVCDDEVDDFIPLLSPEDAVRVREYADRVKLFWFGVDASIEKIVYDGVAEGYDAKQMNTWIDDHPVYKPWKSIIMSYFRHVNSDKVDDAPSDTFKIMPRILDMVKKNCGSTPAVESMRNTLLGGIVY